MASVVARGAPPLPSDHGPAVTVVTAVVPRIWTPESDAQVRHAAGRMMKEAGVGDRLPTPVDDVVACAKLVVSGEITLSTAHEGFFSRSYGALRSALSKLMGLVDLRENVIYLNPDVLSQKKAFLKLHEAGHKALPWQRDAYLFEDDETTLDPDVHELYEHEASRFASDMLFQLDRFDRDAADLPLAVTSPLSLSKRYGASAHAAIRRFVERSRQPLGLLVLERRVGHAQGEVWLTTRRVVQSPTFTRRFGPLAWPRSLDARHPVAEALLRGRRFCEGEISLLACDGRPVACIFDSFENKFNAFVLIRPADVQHQVRTRIGVGRQEAGLPHAARS